MVRRLCKHHQQVVYSNSKDLHTLIGHLITLADSLRSSLSKNALLTISDMFVNLKRCMESSLDRIIKILLKKGSDTNAFISEEAEKGIIAMVTHC